MSAMPPPPPPPGPATGSTSSAPSAPPSPAVVPLDPPPRPGELTLVWRTVTAFAWIGAIMAFAAVWNASVQLGLSTWWLGPRGDPQPRLVQLAPFVAPGLMVLGTINNVRWLGRFGLLAAAYLAAFGIGDLGRTGSIAATELAIAAATAAVSIASLTGTYLTPTPAAAGEAVEATLHDGNGVHPPT